MTRQERRLQRRRRQVRLRRLRFGAAAVATGLGLSATAARAQTAGRGQSESRAWAEAAFSDLVGRRMSAKAAARWEAELAAGGSRADLVTSVVSSRELHARLTGLLFELYLDRSPQADELAAWTTMLDAGAPYLALETALLASPEYAPTDASFVARLYADVLDRAPEPAGRDYWIFQIGAGLPRGAVAGQFLRSEEATVLRSDQTSLAFFDRFVDLDADAALIADLRMTGDWPAQWATAVQSPEYERAERDDAGGGADEAGSALVEAIWGHRPGRPG